MAARPAGSDADAGTERREEVMFQIQAIAFCAAILCAQSVYAQDRNEEARMYLGFCAGERHDPYLTCDQDQQWFMKSYELGFRGEYTGQTEVAYYFEFGADGAVVPDRVQACAWNFVVIGYGHPEAREFAAENTRRTCGRLDQEERTAAQARASRILEEIDPLSKAELEAIRDEFQRSLSKNSKDSVQKESTPDGNRNFRGFFDLGNGN